MVGVHLQTNTIKGSPQGQGLYQTPNTGQFKVVREGAERAEEEQPTFLERMNADSRTTQKTSQEPKVKKRVRGREASKLDTGNWGTVRWPPVQGNLIEDSKVKVSLKGKWHDKAGKAGTKDEQSNPHLKDDNGNTAPRQDVFGRQPFEKQHAPQGPQDQDADSLADPNPAGARSPEPTSSPAQTRPRGEEPRPLEVI